MSLRDRHLDDATVVSKGEFRLDRRRAMEKLSRFQLEHPHRYVLELVACAVRAGATGIAIVNDADDFEIEWDGDHPTADELDALFDHVFTRSSDDRARMLQHLAQGVHGALGLRPRWVRLERPGARLDLTDPLAVSREASPRREGVHVHVRERFGLAVVREWIGETREEDVLRADAAWCPIPIEVNGRPLRRPLIGPPPDRPTREGLWLAGQGSVAVVRDGIRVESVHVDLGELSLVGHVVADGLKLNASRSKAVQDKHWRAVKRRLLEVSAELLVELHEQIGWETAARAAAVRLMLDLRSGPITQVKIVQDAARRLWSLSELRRARTIHVFKARTVAAPEIEEPQFLEASPILAVLGRAKIETSDSNRLFEDLAQGRQRRAQLRARSTPLSHGATLHERRFEDEGGRGSAAFLDGSEEGARVELRVEGLPVETVALPLGGAISVRLEDEALRADPRFRRIPEGAARTKAIRRATEEARALLDEVAERYASKAPVRTALLASIAAGRVTEPIERAAVFDTLDEGRVSLETLRAWSREHGGLEHAKPSAVLPFGTPRVLHPRGGQLKALRKHFKKLRDVTQDLEDELVRRRRLSAPPIPPRIGEYVVARAFVETPDFHGELGLGVEQGEDRTQVRVLHHGVDLGVLAVPVGLPSTVAVLELPTAEGNARMDALANPQGWIDALAKALKGPLRALVLAHAQPPEPDAPLQAWLEGALRMWRPLPRELESLGFARRLDRSSFSAADLEDLPEGPIEYVPTDLGPPPPDLGGVLVLDAGRRRVLKSLTGRALRDVSQRFNLRREAHDRFLRRSITAPVPVGDVVGVQIFDEGGLRVAVALSVEGDREPGLRVRVVHHDRLLCTELQPFPVPADAVVTGDGVRPDPLYNGVEDRHSVLGAVLERAERALEKWVGFPALPAPAKRRLLVYLLRLSAPSPGEKAALDKLSGFPLIPRMDGSLARLSELPEVVVVAPERAAGAEAPDGRVWLLSNPGLRAVLEAAQVSIVPGGPLLEAYEKGRTRRERLGQEVLIPAGAYPSFQRVDEGHARYWLGLLPHGEGRIEWLVERRVLHRVTLPFPVHVRVSDPSLVANPEFTAVKPGADWTRSGDRVLELADAFMEGQAAVAVGEDPGPVNVLGDQGRLRALLIWSRDRHRGELAFLPTSTGELIAPDQLESPIRVVPEGMRGRPAEGHVLSIESGLWIHLKAFGKVQDYAKELVREVAAEARRSAPPKRETPPMDPDALWTRELEGEREGYLRVRGDGRTDLHLHVGWRALGRIAHGGPAPLCGHVSDAAISPDAGWSGPEDGPALQALRQFLTRQSEEAALELLAREGPRPLRLWLGIVRRTWRHRRDMKKPGGSGWKDRIAQLPLFWTGSGQVLSAWEVISLRHPPRWVTPALAAPSPDPKQPLMVIPQPLLSMAIEFFGGELAKDAALEAKRIQSRRGRDPLPMQLGGNYLAELRTSGPGWEAVVALDVELGSGRVQYRDARGVPLSKEDRNLPGFAAVVEVDEPLSDYSGPREDPRREAALERAYEDLVKAASRRVRESWFGRSRLAAVLPGVTKAVRQAWSGVDMLETPAGWASGEDAAASVREHGVVLTGHEVPDEGPLVVLPDGVNERLLAALGHRFAEGAEWEERRLRKAEREAATRKNADAARAHNQLLAAMKEHLEALLDGLHAAPASLADPSDLNPALRAAARTDPRAALVAAWMLADAELCRRGELSAAQEVAIRAGERLG